MALDTFANLKTAIADWLNRDDLTSQVPDFVSLAESRIKMRLRRKTVRTTTSISTEATTLPVTLAELRSIKLTTASLQLDIPLHVGTMEQLYDLKARFGASVGRPQIACVIGTQLYVAPAPDATYTAEITYYQQLTPLSVSVTSNDVLVEAPGLYLYGALLEAAPYLHDDERIPTWERKFETALAELDNVREREELNASIRPVRLPVSF